MTAPVKPMATVGYINSFFIADLLRGLAATFQLTWRLSSTGPRNLSRPPATPYPALLRGEGDKERCIACKLCEGVCPSLAVTINKVEWDNHERLPLFDVDISRCTQCGFCAEVCPVKAISYLSRSLPLTDGAHTASA